MRGIDFSSWQAVLSTVLGLGVVTLVMVGIRLMFMLTIQQRRERENRQINERLRTLIAAYKTLGGSFTGNLGVDPAHLRDLRGAAVDDDAAPASDRRRRIRDAVEAALSDILLLGTEEQVRLAAQAASDLAAGRTVQTAELVISLRTFIREVLDLDPVPAAIALPPQGPVRPAAGGSRGGARGEGGNARGGGGGGRGGGEGGGAGLGMGPAASHGPDDEHRV
ncbi:MAG: hypothetical protein K8R60_03375 [Burkholderiales bacterium]|nr:hypothetical protein [Burkholderiales bacterium]